QLHLLNDCKLTVETIVGRIAALRFFFIKVLRRRYREIDLVYPKRPERLPVILSEEEVARLIESASTSYHRVILMTLYGTGLRREELCRLKVTDVDSQRIVIHIRQNKNNHNHDVPLSPQLLKMVANLLEMEKTDDVPVSELLHLSSGKTDYVAYGVECCARSRTACGDQEKGISALAAPQLGNTPIGAR